MNRWDLLGLKGALISVDDPDDAEEIARRAEETASLAENIEKLNEKIAELESRSEFFWKIAIRDKMLKVNGKYIEKYCSSKAAYIATAKRELESQSIQILGDNALADFQRAITLQFRSLDREYDELGVSIHGIFVGAEATGALWFPGAEEEVTAAGMASFLNVVASGSGFRGRLVRATCGSEDGVTCEGLSFQSQTPFLNVGRGTKHSQCSADLYTFDVLKYLFKKGPDGPHDLVPADEETTGIDPDDTFAGWHK